jgi:ligand-binding sensor domain-containing protein
MTKQIVTTLLILLSYLLAPNPAAAVDTLNVTTPDPLTEKWRWTAFDKENGLKGKIYDIFEDKDGRIWIATGAGVQCYDGYTLTTYTEKDGLLRNRAHTISQDQKGAMWFGTWRGISKFDGANWLTYNQDSGLPEGGVRVLHHTRNGELWAGFATRFDSLGTQSGIARFDGVPCPPGMFPVLELGYG